MRQTTVTCDRCTRRIDKEQGVGQVQGTLKPYYPIAADLCRDCYWELQDWLKGEDAAPPREGQE